MDKIKSYSPVQFAADLIRNYGIQIAQKQIYEFVDNLTEIIVVKENIIPATAARAEPIKKFK